MNTQPSPEELSRFLDEPSKDKAMYREKKFPVMEYFGPTIQGEGSVAGMPTYFLRLGGCDYKCERCDSMHAVLPALIKKNAQMMTSGQIVDMVNGATRLTDAITISGGNPLMWDITDIASALNFMGWKIYVETQGTIFRPWLTYCTEVTVSPKGPGMGEKFELDKFTKFIHECANIGIVPTLKVVVFDQRDIELMVEILSQFPHLQDRAYFSIGNVLPPEPAKRDVGPEIEMTQDEFVGNVLFNYKAIVETVLGDSRQIIRNVRILPQIHTLIWGNEKGR